MDQDEIVDGSKPIQKICAIFPLKKPMLQVAMFCDDEAPSKEML
jgi:hypothetical protein